MSIINMFINEHKFDITNLDGRLLDLEIYKRQSRCATPAIGRDTMDMPMCQLE
jgi:hypothetical protein